MEVMQMQMGNYLYSQAYSTSERSTCVVNMLYVSVLMKYLFYVQGGIVNWN